MNLAEHLITEHDTPRELAETISELGKQILHEGAHSVRIGREVVPDGAGAEHLSTGLRSDNRIGRAMVEATRRSRPAWDR